METLARAANRGSISTGYDIDNSLALKSKSAERLYFTPSSSGNRKTWTFSIWAKFPITDKYCMMMGTADTYMYLDQYGGDLHIRLDGSNYLYTTPVYRDTSAWYHIVLAVDTTQATAANRAKLYVNGEQVTDFATEVYPAQNADTDWNFTNAHYVGGWSVSTYDSDCYIAEVHSVDGQQLSPTDFGEFDSDTGIWKPKAYTGSYGTNGFYLEFKNAADLGDDTSGNNKNFVLSNITSADQATDTPTNSFCTQINSASFLQRSPQTDHATYAGTISQDSSVTNNWTGTMCSFPIFSGKWYWEVKMNQPSEQMCGVHSFIGATGNNTGPYQVDNAWVCYGGGAYWLSYIDGTAAQGGTEGAFSNGTVVGVALDMGGKTLTFYENGGSAGTNLTNIDISSLVDKGDPLIPFIGVFRNAIWTNFGGYTTMSNSTSYADENGYGSFVYQPPSGYYALCSKNLAEFG